MTAATPKKLVHWALNASLSDLGSPFSDAGSSDSCSSTSSLQYVNSQLLAHGFTHGSGLCLDGLAKEDADKVVKCILGMLSQRIDDMSRTEDLTTKLRTLSYDHERLTSMYKAEVDKSANAEREMNLHKSRLAAATKALQSSENAHKHTTAELQRTRTTLHALRATHQTEIKKLEKEKERMVERWSKLSDSQLKVGSLPAGLTCANLQVVEASDVQLRGKTQGFLDVALEQAETARKELYEQNRKLRGILLFAANELQSVLHSVRTAGEADCVEEPSPLTHSALFPNHPAEAAGETISSLFRTLRESISSRTELNAAAACSNPPKPSSSTSTSTANGNKAAESAEVERLQAVIDKLRAELEEAQRQAATSAAQMQELFDRFAEEQAESATRTADVSMDLMTAPARDEERQRLDARFKELEEERQKFTEAAVRLGREKAALEAERLKFLEEKRSWQVDMMLAELPPTPAPGASVPTPVARPPPLPAVLARGSPRKSPRKLKSKAASPRKTRVSRRSSSFGGVALGPASPKAKQKVAPPFETEVIPSTISVPKSPARQPPEFKTSMAASPVPPPPFLPGSFVLPPPSPAASLPTREGGGTPLPPIPPLPKLEIPPPSEDTSGDDSMDITPDPPNSAASSTTSALANPPPPPVPQTPGVRPFPMAKPFAARMIHAYSPAKPSPLSRILMLANSPDSPENSGPALASLPESTAEDESMEQAGSAAPPIRSLAEELGVSEDDDSPLREEQPVPSKPAAQPQGAKRKAAGASSEGERRTQPSRATTASSAAPAAKDKGKARADVVPGAAPTSRTRAGSALEKENVKRTKLSNGAKPPAAQDARKSSRTTSSASAKHAAATARSRAGPGAGGSGSSGGKAPSSRPKGGARRVPVGSAEAAPVPPTWRG
ncbi:Afadin and alpha-actinin-binding-domain-containing protein [Trametes polyzona]|nr:Afadin and alpha-actinin-binding-domain-containing protein [Trametes polyzona]